MFFNIFLFNFLINLKNQIKNSLSKISKQNPDLSLRQRHQFSVILHLKSYSKFNRQLQFQISKIFRYYIQFINLHHQFKAKSSMDSDDIFSEASQENMYCHFQESREYNILDLIPSEQNSYLQADIYDSNESSHSRALASKFQQTQNQLNSECTKQINPETQKPEKTTSSVKKTKIIQKKPPKIANKLLIKKGKNIQVKKQKKKGNQSKYNNMGSFLIGSTSQILNKRGGYRFINGFYEIQIDGKWRNISRLEIVDNQIHHMDLLRRLKRQIENLPRRQGAKKDLFKLINTHPKDAELRKECKRLIRQELIYSLKDDAWLKQHAYSRDFRPNGDEDGSKKKERHEAYIIYLNGIKDALIENGQLPKRLNL